MRNDNGSEYNSIDFIEFCQLYDILRQLFVPYTPQQNDFSKKNNIMIIEVVLSILILTQTKHFSHMMNKRHILF